MVSAAPPAVVVAYVVRRDRQGLGGLLVHQTAEGPEFLLQYAEADAPPAGLLDAAELRLKAMASW
jgi:hypothetical protein